MQILKWKKRVSGSTLRGFVDIEFDIGLQSFEWTVHQNHNGAWLHPPGKPQIDEAGNLRRKPDTNKIDYVAVLKWKDAETRSRFNEHAIKLLLEKHPDALD